MPAGKQGPADVSSPRIGFAKTAQRQHGGVAVRDRKRVRDEAAFANLEFGRHGGGEGVRRQGAVIPRLCWQGSVTVYDEADPATVYVDGTLELSVPSVATISSGTPSGFAIGSLYNQHTYFDDVILWDLSGMAFNTFPLGARRIACLNPNAAGESMQFTPSAGANYSCVSQAYSGSSYVADAASGNTDHYGTAGLTYTPASAINAVVVNMYALNLSGDGTKSLTPKLRFGATPAVARGTSRTLTDSLANYQSTFHQDASPLNWTATTVNAPQPGIRDWRDAYLPIAKGLRRDNHRQRPHEHAASEQGLCGNHHGQRPCLNTRQVAKVYLEVIGDPPSAAAPATTRRVICACT